MINCRSLQVAIDMSPPTIKGKNAEREAALETAKFMLVAARTAPKNRGNR
jgi:hypothetical protein